MIEMQPSRPTAKRHLLVVDDDERLRFLLRQYLSDHGFSVTLAANPKEARRYMNNMIFDILVVDVMMPEEDGLEFVADLHYQAKSPPPILMLSALGEPNQRIKGFEAGSNDYLPKPFEPRELLLRLHNLLQPYSPHRKKEEIMNVIAFGPYHFDRLRFTLTKNQENIKLSPNEQKLMKVFTERPGTVLTRESLSHLCNFSGGIRTVDVVVARLRRKIEADLQKPYYLITRRGQGYMFQPD